MSVRIGNPFAYFRDKRGLPLDGGKAYIGADGADPEVAPGIVYLNAALSVVAPQPLSVIGGLLAYNGNPAQFYFSAESYAIRVRDSDGAEVFYEPSAILNATVWQPLDADLTAIAALTTTAYGRALLTYANAAALLAALGGAASGANADITSIKESTTISGGGSIAATSIGFRGVPLSGQMQGALIVLALTDAGKRVANTTGGWTIPANASVAFPTDTVIVLHNNSAVAQSVAITTDTLTLEGTTTTGTRSVLANGTARLIKTAATSWLIAGSVS